MNVRVVAARIVCSGLTLKESIEAPTQSASINVFFSIFRTKAAGDLDNLQCRCRKATRCVIK